MQLRPKYMHMYLIRNSCRHNLVWLHNPDPVNEVVIDVSFGLISHTLCFGFSSLLFIISGLEYDE